jgi:hypothetical protein
VFSIRSWFLPLTVVLGSMFYGVTLYLVGWPSREVIALALHALAGLAGRLRTGLLREK